jgi:hypothetical protein
VVSTPKKHSKSNKPAKKKVPTSTAAAKSSEEKRHQTHISMDRRASTDRRGETDRRKHHQPVAVERRVLERRKKVTRRRQIDPTTCERDYSIDEVEFMNALDEYKRTSGRMFPTCSEILEVVRTLGYQKTPQPLPTSPGIGDPGVDVLPSLGLPAVNSNQVLARP